MNYGIEVENLTKIYPNFKLDSVTFQMCIRDSPRAEWKADRFRTACSDSYWFYYNSDSSCRGKCDCRTGKCSDESRSK